MTIQIGDEKLAVRTPADLDAALASTGLSAAETLAALRAGGFPGHVATALLPFLDGKLAHADLAALIAGADVDAVRAAVIALYEPKAEGK